MRVARLAFKESNTSVTRQITFTKIHTGRRPTLGPTKPTACQTPADMRRRLNKAGVLWSGGLDSTYLIYWYLSHFPQVKVVGHYIELVNNDQKTKMEKAACDKLAKLFKERFPDRFEWSCGSSFQVRTGFNEVCFKQLPFWLLGGLFIPPVDTMAIGYVMNDDAISYITEIKKAWRSLQFVRRSSSIILEFPLTQIKKDEILDNLPSEFKEHVVWCEQPITEDGVQKPCGRCVSCRRSPLMPATKEIERVVEETIVVPNRSKNGHSEQLVTDLQQRYVETPER